MKNLEKAKEHLQEALKCLPDHMVNIRSNLMKLLDEVNTPAPVVPVPQQTHWSYQQTMGLINYIDQMIKEEKEKIDRLKQPKETDLPDQFLIG